MPTLNQRLVELRKEKGLNQDDLVSVLKCSRSTVSNYENAPSLSSDTLQKFADLYGVTTDYLLCRTNERTPAAGKLAEAFAKLLYACPDSPVNPSDLATFLRSATAYCRAGQPAGSSPLDALHGFLVGLAAAMDAATSGDAVALLDQLNAAISSAMNSSTMMADYYKRTNRNT